MSDRSRDHRPIALILGAGRGTRMGGPKVLLPWEGVPLGRAHAEAALALGCREVYVVVREDFGRLALPDGARLVFSEAPDELGPAGSIAAYVTQHPPADEDWVAVMPVDTKPGAWLSLPALTGGLGRGEAGRPTQGGRGGHPALVRGRLLAAQARSPRPLRELLRELGPAFVDVPVELPDVLSDLDVPGDLVS